MYTNNVWYFRVSWQPVTCDRRGSVHLRLLPLRVRHYSPHGGEPPALAAAAPAHPGVPLAHRRQPAHAEQRHAGQDILRPYKIPRTAHHLPPLSHTSANVRR